MIDYHVHSQISGDCEVSMAQMARAAQRAGIKEICFAEHIDIDLPCEIDFSVDFDAYRKAITAVRLEFPELNIRMGIEAGLDPATKEQMSALLAGQPLDYVIGSQHIVFGHDPFYETVWHQYSQREIYEEYLRLSLECARSCDFYDVLGHLGYVAKFCPYEDKMLRYADFSDAIDTVLTALVEKGKGLEVNTNGLYMTPSTMPETAILERYFALGGEIVTVGSDAHYESVVGHAVPETIKTLKSIGFKYICAFDNRVPRFIPIP